MATSSFLEDLPGAWPQRLTGRSKYSLTDLRLSRGALAVANGDIAVVRGIPALAQAIELGIRHEFAGGENARDIATSFLPYLRASRFDEYLEEVRTVRFTVDEIEYEFRATGFSGVYVHRFGVTGFGGRYECTPILSHHVSVVSALDERLLAQITANPSLLYQLEPRKFEEVIAGLIERMGYQVTLTPYQDDGVDIFALKQDGLAPILTVIDCKKWDPNNPIGVGLIRTLAGLRQQHRANTAMIATTSRFTKNARDLQEEQWPYEVALADFDKLSEWLRRFGWEQDASGLYLPSDMRDGDATMGELLGDGSIDGA